MSAIFSDSSLSLIAVMYSNILGFFKRLDVRAKTVNVDCAVTIIDDIPDEELEIEDDED